MDPDQENCEPGREIVQNRVPGTETEYLLLDDVQMGEKKFTQMYILGHNVGRVHVAVGKQETVLINELL